MTNVCPLWYSSYFTALAGLRYQVEPPYRKAGASSCCRNSFTFEVMSLQKCALLNQDIITQYHAAASTGGRYPRFFTSRAIPARELLADWSMGAMAVVQMMAMAPGRPYRLGGAHSPAAEAGRRCLINENCDAGCCGGYAFNGYGCSDLDKWRAL